MFLFLSILIYFGGKVPTKQTLFILDFKFMICDFSSIPHKIPSRERELLRIESNVDGCAVCNAHSLINSMYNPSDSVH